MPVVKATETFRKRAARLLTDAEYAALAEFLAAHPESGDVVAGTGGVRKLRQYLPSQRLSRRSVRSCRDGRYNLMIDVPTFCESRY